MARNRAIKRLEKPKPKAPAPLSRRQDMYAPQWDDSNVQVDRVADRAKKQRYIDKGPSGIEGK